MVRLHARVGMFNNSVARDAGIPPYVVVDTADVDRVTAFWCALLGVGVLENRDDGHYVTLEPAPSLPGSMMLVFQRVPEVKVAKNRAHVDMFVDDLDEAVTKIEELGGRLTEPGTTVNEGGWLSRVMADPEGNEFCVCLVRAGRRTDS
jgi:predicted enzyme related to lactoylglutathione lyase